MAPFQEQYRQRSTANGAVGFHDGHLRMDAIVDEYACLIALSIVTVLRYKKHFASLPVLSTGRSARPALAANLAGSKSLYIPWITGILAH
jgi:hypothetical protein